MALIPFSEVARHNTKESCWMIIHGKVYDVTKFVPEHPGGTQILWKLAGKDATEDFDPIHPKSIIAEHLTPEQYIGDIDASTVPKPEPKPETKLTKESKPRLGLCQNLDHFQDAAEVLLSDKAWAFYRSAADDENTLHWNHDSFNKIRFRPRILRPVEHVDTSTHLLGYRSRLPIFVAPAALAKLAHPDGEAALVRAANKFGIIQCTSANASMSATEIAEASVPGQVQFYQHYMAADRERARKTLLTAKEAGYKAILLTVDTITLGKRERDERQTMDPDLVEPDPDAISGVAKSSASYFDFGLAWRDIPWIKNITGLPVAIKGVQTAEDAVLCSMAGADVIYLSNHGGRQLEGAPSAIETLIEMRRYCPEIVNRSEIWIDGGIRRGTDVLKALALGARAVGLGRPFLYSLAFGQPGAERVIRIMEEEIITGMRLLGITNLSQLGPEYVNASYFENLLTRDYREPTRSML